MVFFHHFTPSTDLVGQLMYAVFWEGHVGVSIFFVLSGFLIALNYADSVSLRWRWILSYARNRFARIYPVYFLATVITQIYIQDFRPIAWFLNLSLLRGFLGDYYFYHIGQAWSLTVELCFYLLAPVILLLLGRVPIGLQCLLLYILGYGLSQLGTLFPEIRFLEPQRMLVANTFFGRCFEFYVGAWMYLFFRNKTPFYHRFKICSGLTTYIGMLLTGLTIYGFTICYGLAVYSPECAPMHHYVFPIAAALLIFGLWKEKTFVSMVLGSKPMVVLGKASYIFYLIHAFPFKEMLGMANTSIYVHFFTVNVLSVLVFYLYERPLQRLLRSPK